MNKPPITFRTLRHLLFSLLLTSASVIPAYAQERSEEMFLVETTVGNRFNTYSSFDTYKAAGTTVSVLNKNLSPKPQTQDKSVFVIYGVDFASEGFKNGDFIYLGDLATTEIADSEFDGLTLPITGAVITFRKSTIGMLAPDADCYIIDGKKVSSTEFEALTATEIQCVTILDKKLLVKKHFITDENIDNVDVKKASDDEGYLMRMRFSEPDKD